MRTCLSHRIITYDLTILPDPLAKPFFFASHHPRNQPKFATSELRDQPSPPEPSFFRDLPIRANFITRTSPSPPNQTSLPYTFLRPHFRPIIHSQPSSTQPPCLPFLLHQLHQTCKSLFHRNPLNFASHRPNPSATFIFFASQPSSYFAPSYFATLTEQLNPHELHLLHQNNPIRANSTPIQSPNIARTPTISELHPSTFELHLIQPRELTHSSHRTPTPITSRTTISLIFFATLSASHLSYFAPLSEPAFTN